MGTSASSSGPGVGVPFDPPWLDDIAPPAPGSEDQGFPNSEDGEDAPATQSTPAPPSEPPLLAPPRRFANARRAINKFVKTGQRDSFKRAAGHYSRTGMGGSANVGRRLRSSANTGAHVFGMLQSARDGSDPAITEWVASLTRRNADAHEVVNEIIKRAVPAGGSQDEASSQDSMSQALQDLIAQDENIDFFHLSDDEIWLLIESFLGYEAFSRMCLDIGQVFENAALMVRDQVARMNEMQAYLKADLAAQIEKLRSLTLNASSGQLQAVLKKAIENTFAVYEGAI